MALLHFVQEVDKLLHDYKKRVCVEHFGNTFDVCFFICGGVFFL